MLKFCCQQLYKKDVSREGNLEYLPTNQYFCSITSSINACPLFGDNIKHIGGNKFITNLFVLLVITHPKIMMPISLLHEAYYVIVECLAFASKLWMFQKGLDKKHTGYNC